MLLLLLILSPFPLPGALLNYLIFHLFVDLNTSPHPDSAPVPPPPEAAAVCRLVVYEWLAACLVMSIE